MARKTSSKRKAKPAKKSSGKRKKRKSSSKGKNPAKVVRKLPASFTIALPLCPTENVKHKRTMKDCVLKRSKNGNRITYSISGKCTTCNGGGSRIIGGENALKKLNL